MIRTAWLAYAALLTGAVLLGEVGNLAQGGGLEPRTVANWVVTAVLLIATWGYALKRPIGTPAYWRPAFWVLVVATLATVIPAALAGNTARTFVALLLPLVAPAFYATYRYAYRSPQLWRDREPPP